MIAPWLQAPNVLAAMEGGTNAGLALRRQSDEESQFAQRANQENRQDQERQDDAAQRLRLSYDSLAQQHDLSRQEIAARAAQGQAAMALHQQANDSLQTWRQQQGQNQQERLKIAAANALKQSTTTEPMTKTFEDGTTVVYNPKGGGFHVVTNKGQEKPLTPAEQLKLAGLTDDPDFKKSLIDDLKRKVSPTSPGNFSIQASPDFSPAALLSTDAQPAFTFTGTAPKQASGGYKIGSTYKGGLTYLGGDPNDESSWQKASESEQ